LKSEKLLFLIGEIDDKFIEEAAIPYKQKPHYLRYGALAASFLIIVFVAISAFGNVGSKFSAGSSFLDGAANLITNAGNKAPETAYDENKSYTADSTTIDSDIADDGNTDYGLGFYAIINNIDIEKRIITVTFNEKNNFFEQTIEINYDTLKGTIPFEELSINEKIEVLVSVNDTAEIVSIRK